jgi:LuxR family transcriptional regulator, quorum-sensing system regulator BjaR1
MSKSTIDKLLTLREREVLWWAAEGKSAWEIGEILYITKRTVDAHTQHAARKLGASNKTHAVAIALRERLVGKNPPSGEPESRS